MSFDPKCLELAEYFLGDAPREVLYAMARAIQDAVEDNMPVEEDPGIQAHMATPFAENH